MNPYLAAAAALAVLVGLVHSVLGERFVFSRMRQGELVPTNGGTVLRQPHVRILWASWHALSVLGWAIAAAILLLAAEPSLDNLHASLLHVMAVAMLASVLSRLYVSKVYAVFQGWYRRWRST
jgi:hypothetical protein